MARSNDIYDAAVVGGGIIGLATALKLAAAGFRLALIERTPPMRRRGQLGFDIRTVALTGASVDFVSDIVGRANMTSDCELAPIKTMRVWEHDGAASLTFTHAAPLAWVAENSALTASLWRAAADRLDLIAPATVTGLAGQGNAALLAIESDSDARQSTLAARLVIAADGENSVVRTLSGVSVRKESSPRRGPQRAIATVARTRRSHNNTAWQRFGATGPVALLPLAEEHTVAVIWSTSETVNQRLQGLPDDDFRGALTTETEAVTGGFDAVDRRLSFPLRQALASDFNPAPRLLIIGDAARTLHPLAGQGVNIGLEEARAIATEAGSGGDLGTPGRWRDFARERRARSKTMMTLMRTLLAAYCGTGAGEPWLRLARNAAVRAIDASPAIKAQLVREAMGLGPLAGAGRQQASAA